MGDRLMGSLTPARRVCRARPRLVAALLFVFLPLLTAMPAAAGYLHFGVGGAIEMVDSTTQIKLTQELGMHVGRVRRGGLVLGLALSESFGDDLVGFQAGPKLGWDLRILASRRAQLFFGPSLQLGYGLFAPSGGDASHFFNVEVGAAFKLCIRRLLLFFQPFGLDMYFADPFIMRYDIVGGIGTLF